MVGKVGVEGFVDLFSPFHLLLRAVVVAQTKEERVFHSGSAESSVMIHADGRSSMSFTTRGHHTYTRCKSQNGKHAARTLEATQFKTPANLLSRIL